MRESEWRVVWNPLGASPRVLLTFGDLMEDEHARTLDQSVEIGRSDFAKLGRPISRGNVRRRLDFTRRNEHASAGESWDACARAIQTAPWGEKAMLQVQGRGSSVMLYTAALLSSDHETSTGFDLPESVHHYSFRIGPQGASLGQGIAVLGGLISGVIDLIIDPADLTDIDVGNIIFVEGVSNVPDGFYHVIDKGPNFVSINGDKSAADYFPPPDDDSDGEDEITIRSAYSSSPRPYPPPQNEFVHSATKTLFISSVLPYQLLTPSGWETFQPGADGISGGVGTIESFGSWNGLTETSVTQTIKYPKVIGQVQLRNIGDSGSDLIFYKLQARGHVIFDPNSTGLGSTVLPRKVVRYAQGGGGGGGGGMIPPGGTIRKATIEEVAGQPIS